MGGTRNEQKQKKGEKKHKPLVAHTRTNLGR